MDERQHLDVVGARTHNLQNIRCRIPHGKVTVVTGPSGAGKSSLVFDTIFAEGQRRYVESLSTYARQFLAQLERPPVDDLLGVLPAVALEAKNSIRNARSTVGTMTEIHDVLRLLFTNLGVPHCPAGHGPGRRWTAPEVVEQLVRGGAGERFLLLVRLPRPPRRASDALDELVRQGFLRRLEGDEVVRMAPGHGWPRRLDPLPLVLGRFRAGGASSARLADTVEEGWRLGTDLLEARGEGATLHFSPHLSCVTCGERLREPEPALFSFNSPLGACSECQGFGRVIGIDAGRVVPNPELTLEERPFAPWNTPSYEELTDDLLAACAERRVPTDVPWRELPEETRSWIWGGDEGFVGIEPFFAWLERRKYKVHVRVLLSRYRAYTRCPRCEGARLNREARRVLLSGWPLSELVAMSVEELRRWLAEQRWAPEERLRAGHLLEQLAERLEVLHRVGLDYLTLDRQARTLSGGETQRIHLAAALGSGLTRTLYALDEPTIGLHPADSRRLLGLLRDLAERGNTVVVVEHDRQVILGADHVIDLGPAAGERGGEVVAEGSPEEILGSETSLTARFLRERPATAARQHVDRYRRERGWRSVAEEVARRPRLAIRGARAHNLQGIDVEMPLASLVAVTGVSGSGKSTLIENVLYGNFQRRRGVVEVEPGECDALEGLEGLVDVTLVDQQPLGRSNRSNPVTYLKAYDEIRKLFAATPAALRDGITAGHFSFNLDNGRCPACKGTGLLEVDMHFMAPVTVSCDRCGGRRFKRQVLAVRCRGLTIAQVLDLSVEAALTTFRDQTRLCRRLECLLDVGLGYLRLGQPTSTLSGGEAQRLKLASFLGRSASDGRRLFLFDEPTTGLHLADIDLLVRTLRRLVQGGDTVLVVEHHLDLVRRADWIVDLGPGGGSRGGRLLFSGPLGRFLEEGEGPTAEALREHLRGVETGPGRRDGRRPSVATAR